MRFAPGLATIGLLASAFASPLVVPASDGPKTPNSAEAKPVEAPIPVFLNAPSDRESFWKMLGRPDLVILDGELYRKLRQAAEPSPKPTGLPLAAVVESLAATGEVAGDWARLSVEYRVALETEGPAWVSIHLDGLTLTEAREGTKELPTRMTEGRTWQVELRGKGDHLVRVRLLAPVRSTAEGRRLDLPIPPVASTRVDLVVPQTVLDASTGPNEMVSIAPAEGGVGSRLAARLSPRSKIELVWRERADPALKLPALLSAQGSIAVEVERGSIRTGSSWIVGAVRGTASQLTIRLDAAEEVLDVEVDGKPVQVETRREGGRSIVSIPLAEPLRSSTTRGVTLTTKRPIASSGIARVSLEGYSFDQAKVQTGVIAVARSGPLFLNPTPGRGLRRIDPRTELPDTLRNAADTVLAFEFTDQSFELGLSIEPAPPRLRVENRTTISLDPRTARLQTRLECRTSQGRMFEVQVILPKGLDFEGAEPPDVVESAQSVPLDPDAGAAVGVDAARMLSIVLTPQAREGEVFTIVLNGRCLIDPSRPVALPLFKPVVNSTSGARFALVAERTETWRSTFPRPETSRRGSGSIGACLRPTGSGRSGGPAPSRRCSGSDPTPIPRHCRSGPASTRDRSATSRAWPRRSTVEGPRWSTRSPARWPSGRSPGSISRSLERWAIAGKSKGSRGPSGSRSNRTRTGPDAIGSGSLATTPTRSAFGFATAWSSPSRRARTAKDGSGSPRSVSSKGHRPAIAC